MTRRAARFLVSYSTFHTVTFAAAVRLESVTPRTRMSAVPPLSLSRLSRFNCFNLDDGDGNDDGDGEDDDDEEAADLF